MALHGFTSQWNSHLTGIMISKTIGFRGTRHFQTHPYLHERSAKPQLKNAIFGPKLSFLGVHYIVLQYILIASFASPGKLRAKSLFTPPLQRLKHVWLPYAFFCSAPTVWYGMIPINATANHSCTICWKKSGWALTVTCSMPFIHSPASG